jgi:UDP-N-acetylglucosamine acyltransferase
LAEIHETAIIHASAELAESAVVGPYCVVGPRCVVGPDTRLEVGVHLKQDVTLGTGNKVHSYAVLGGEPQHLAYKPHPGRVVIGDRNTLHEHFTIHKPYVEGAETRVGNDCFFMASSHVGHDAVVGNNVILANASALGGHVVVNDRANISAFVGVHQFTRVGRLTMIGGVCRLTGDVPPFCMVVGDFLVGLNAIGMKRNGIQQKARSQVKAVFKLIFAQGRAIGKGVEAAQAQIAAWGADAAPEAIEFASFVAARGKRHVTRYDASRQTTDDE